MLAAGCEVFLKIAGYSFLALLHSSTFNKQINYFFKCQLKCTKYTIVEIEDTLNYFKKIANRTQTIKNSNYMVGGSPVVVPETIHTHSKEG